MLLLASAIPAQAQFDGFEPGGSSSSSSWLANGSNNYSFSPAVTGFDSTLLYIRNTGQVGIGNVSPDSMFTSGSPTNKGGIHVFGGGLFHGNLTYKQLLGGISPIATGYLASVMGGTNNAATGDSSWVGGGGYNQATGLSSVVGGGTGNVAAADHSVIPGGLSNVIPPGSPGRAVIAGGSGNSMSGNSVTSSVISGGSGNTLITGSTYGVIGGGSVNKIDWSASSVISGGAGNVIGDLGAGIQASAASIPGGTLAKVRHYGGFAHASGSFTTTAGTAQVVELIARDTTSLAENDTLYLDGTELPLTGLGLQAVIDTGTVWKFTVDVAARTKDGRGAGYHFRGTIKNITGTVSFIGTPVKDTPDEDAAGWDCNVAANDTHNALSIIVTGEDGAIIRWVATIRLTQVRW